MVHLSSHLWHSAELVTSMELRCWLLHELAALAFIFDFASIHSVLELSYMRDEKCEIMSLRPIHSV
jgi:hypothetical protein